MVANLSRKFLSSLAQEQSEQQKSSIILYVIIAACVVVTTGCGSKIPQASRDLAAKITRDLPHPPTDPDPSKVSDERRVYLDASLSMKGFVNPMHHSRFDEFLDAIGDAMPGCQLYKYGQRGEKPPDNNQTLSERIRFGLELHRPEFYDLTYNPDDRLIQQLANEEHPALSVLITDGVYSEPQGATSPPVVQGIQKWMDQGNTFGILILKSRFDGPFYSEHERKMLSKFSVEERPFYAFVFSPTVKGFKELQENLERRFPETEMQTILFSDDAVSCVPKLDPKLKGVYSFSNPPTSPYYWQMFNDKLFDQANPAHVQYSVSCTISPTYPIAQLGFDTVSEYYRWEKGAFKKAERPPDGFQVVPSSNSPATSMAVTFPKDTSSDYGFYYLRMIPSPRSLRPEIKNNSTLDDETQEEARKTYRFNELITSLVNTHFKSHLTDKASPVIFVTIENH